MWLSFNEMIQAIGQFGTVGAFVVGIYQFQKSKQDTADAALKELQVALASEARPYITSMITELDRRRGENFTMAELFVFIRTMADLGGHFARFYRQLGPCVQRDVLNGEWQDMYFNKLIPILRGLDIIPLSSQLPNYIDVGSIRAAIGAAQGDYEANGYPEVLKGYYKTKHMLERFSDFYTWEVLRDITVGISSLYLFKLYFFEDQIVRTLLEGRVTEVDFRTVAPPLAALFEKYGNAYITV